MVALTMTHDQFICASRIISAATSVENLENLQIFGIVTGTYIGKLFTRLASPEEFRQFRGTYEYMMIETKLQQMPRMLIGWPHLPKSKLGRGGKIPLSRKKTWEGVRCTYSKTFHRALFTTIIGVT